MKTSNEHLICNQSDIFHYNERLFSISYIHDFISPPLKKNIIHITKKLNKFFEWDIKLGNMEIN
jgi:hypothetical protein